MSAPKYRLDRLLQLAAKKLPIQDVNQFKISASNTVDTSRKMDFFALPPEIRNEIYSLLVISPHPIKVRSPRKQHEIRKIVNPSNFCQLLCVNKQMNTEASAMFYAVNTFTFGNGPFGSKKYANLHGLQHFLKRVPKDHVSGIENVNVLIHARDNHSRGWGAEYDLGTPIDAKNLHSIIRALTKHFTSLKTVKFQYCTFGPSWYSMAEPRPLLSEAEVTRELVKMFRILGNKGLHFEIFDHYRIDMRQAAETILKENPGAADLLTLPPHPS